MRFANPSKKLRSFASLKGHSVNFIGKQSMRDGKPVDPDFKTPEGAMLTEDGLVFVYVPPAIREEVTNIGMIPETENEEPEVAVRAKKPEDATKLKEALYTAFDILVEAAERESFTAAGTPKVKYVERLLGYDVTQDEVKDTFAAYQIDKAAAN